MSSVSMMTEIPRHGRPAVLARLFGWTNLMMLIALILNNVLVVGFDFPGLGAFIAGNTAGGWIHPALYVVAFVIAVGVTLRDQATSVRWDAHRVHRFNVYLIRALFWAVFFVGIVDATIAFMRIEGGLDALLGEDLSRNFSRAGWVATHVHAPLIALGFVVGFFTRTLGFPWLAILIVAAELLIVISRFVFSYEQAFMSDLVRYWYAALFLFASAYTLFDEGHVRVDILYAGFGRSRRGYVNAMGTILLGLSTAWVILVIALDGKQSIVNAPVANFEISQSGPFGMFTKYQMAAFLALFGVTMLIQFVSYFFDAIADKTGEPGHREPAQDAAH
ncbi:MAG: TRAP transporter small permease subunit [Maritimibacter sp.]